MSPDVELTCPKCGSEWRSYERNGVVVDQCTGCRGVFLDRGELERLVDAEGAHYERENSGREREDSGRRHQGHSEQRPKKNRKRSFLESILEGGGD